MATAGAYKDSVYTTISYLVPTIQYMMKNVVIIKNVYVDCLVHLIISLRYFTPNKSTGHGFEGKGIVSLHMM